MKISYYMIVVHKDHFFGYQTRFGDLVGPISAGVPCVGTMMCISILERKKKKEKRKG